MITPTLFPRSWDSRNLIRFCRHPGFDALDPSFAADYALRAGMGRFSVLKNPRTLPGPDDCFGHIQMDARRVFEKMLGLEVSYPELSADATARLGLYNSMNYYRSHIEERFYHSGVKPLPPVEGLCLIFSPAPDVWRVVYRLRGTAPVAVDLQLQWISVPAAAPQSRVASSTRSAFARAFGCTVSGSA